MSKKTQTLNFDKTSKIINISSAMASALALGTIGILSFEEIILPNSAVQNPTIIIGIGGMIFGTLGYTVGDMFSEKICQLFHKKKLSFKQKENNYYEK